MTPRPSFPVSALDYDLPTELIAQAPPPRREDARLLVVDRASDAIRDAGIVDFPDLLRAGDLMVLNDTKVLPAKLSVRRATGGMLGGLFLEETAPGEWRILLEGSRRVRIGEALQALGRSGRTVSLTLVERLETGQWRVRVDSTMDTEGTLDDIGLTPLPPYIRRSAKDGVADQDDRKRYQTVFARRVGAVAAPTAGFHLTESILDRIRNRGVTVAFVTLHVGMGTFKPVVVEDLSRHVMHSERFDLPTETVEAVKQCKEQGGRVVAVGTTSVRVLETAARVADGSTLLAPATGQTQLLIYPPYPFKFVDALLTNFHLPRSTLLALVMAFAGEDRTRRAYAHAVAQRYRFYSFGDTMFIA